MKLSRNKMLLVSFMLFSLFFGAGNLIFPPFLGQNAGSHTLPAMLGFLATAVVLPVLGVVVVARFDGLDRLGQQVGKRFAIVFTLLIYLSIGPGLGIPRAASVPFEMAVAPYLPEGTNTTVWMLVYSLAFFLVALWLCMTPGKLVNRIGHFLTPSLLVLLVFLFVCFLFRGEVNVAPSQTAYDVAPFLKGFSEGYQTMDTIAALNFGLVIATTLGSFGMTEKRDRMRHTVLAGIFAGTILALVYAMLSYMGMCSSGVYAIQENGAMDPAVHRLPAVRCAGSRAAGGHLHAGLSHHLRGAYQLHLPVFLHPFRKALLPPVGAGDDGLLLFGVQSGTERHPQRLHPHSQRHLPRGHCADPAGADPQPVGQESLGLLSGGGGHRNRQRHLCVGCRTAVAGRCDGTLPEAAPVRYGLLLGQCGGGDAGSEPAAGSCAAGTGVRGRKSLPFSSKAGRMRHILHRKEFFS